MFFADGTFYGNNIRRGGIPFRPFVLRSALWVLGICHRGFIPRSCQNWTPHPSFGHPVLDLLHAHRVSHKLLRNNMLNLFAIRTRYALSVRKFALPQRGEGTSFAPSVRKSALPQRGEGTSFVQWWFYFSAS